MRIVYRTLKVGSFGLTGSKSEKMIQKSQRPDEPEEKSIHSGQIQEVHNIPLSCLMRPIPSVLDEQKVASLMETIKVSRCRPDRRTFLGFPFGGLWSS